jgi:SAM-dependent methyltransferase
MEAKDWYKNWFSSPYYHQLYQHRDDTEANEFIIKLIGYLQPENGSSMLDVACGKGRHSKALAEMGYDVTGIDLALPSIEEAKLSEHEKLHFYQHDMRLPFWINYFDFAFNFFTSFGYFKTKREHNNALRTIAQSIKENGVFVIDYLNVQFSENLEQNTKLIRVENTEFHIKKWHDNDYFFKQIQVLDESNHSLEDLYTERVAKFTLADFTEMLGLQNMEITDVFGDYQLGNYNEEQSTRLIIVAKKKAYKNQVEK